jgi:hypothetical protein
MRHSGKTVLLREMPAKAAVASCLCAKVPCDIVAFAEAKKTADAPRPYHDI